MRGLLQLARVSQPPRTLVAHHEFPSTSCFCASSETPNSTEHEYMQMNGLSYAFDSQLLQTISYNGLFAIELHSVWCLIGSLIFTLRQLLHWQASQAARCLSCSVLSIVLFPSSWTVDRTVILTVTPNWWCHENAGSSFQLSEGVILENTAIELNIWVMFPHIRSTWKCTFISDRLLWPLWPSWNDIFHTTESAHAIPKGNRMRCFSLMSKKECPSICIYRDLMRLI